MKSFTGIFAQLFQKLLNLRFSRRILFELLQKLDALLAYHIQPIVAKCDQTLWLIAHVHSEIGGKVKVLDNFTDNPMSLIRDNKQLE